MKTYLIGLVFILVSCNGQKKASLKNSSDQSKSDSSLVLLLQDEYAGFVVEETMVIRDQKRLKSFYSKINKTRKPGFPVPVIDFSKEMVIVQCTGEQNHVGLPTLALSRETDSEIVLMAITDRETKTSTITVVTNPYCVYKMPLTDKKVLVESNHK